MITILAVGTSIPEFVVTNDYVVSLVLERSSHIYRGDLNELEKQTRSFLDKVGANRRRWRAGKTKPIEHIADAWRNCFEKIGDADRGKIGTLIYCGIDKGVVEPSHASFLAQKFGLPGARTFDVSDACMGWLTATQVAATFATRDQPLCAIISAEFPIEIPGKVYPRAFEIKNDDDLLWKEAALTLGECASVSIVESTNYVPTELVFRSRNDQADLCCVPLERPERFVESAHIGDRLAQNCFIADSRKMAAAGYRDGQEVLARYVQLYGCPAVLLPHTVSLTLPNHIARDIVPTGVLKNSFDTFGNISTCSIPVGYEFFHCDSADNLHIAGWIAAAGMSHSVFRLYKSS